MANLFQMGAQSVMNSMFSQGQQPGQSDASQQQNQSNGPENFLGKSPFVVVGIRPGTDLFE